MILKFLKMKKITILISAFLLSGIISGQSSFDYLLLGKALVGMGKADQAIEVLSTALKEKNDSRLLSERAEAKIVKGDLSGAISDFNSANTITQYSGDYGLARVYAMRGDASTSLYHLEMNLKSLFKRNEKEIMLDPAFGKIENRPEWRSFWKKRGIPFLKRAFLRSGITFQTEISKKLLQSSQECKETTLAVRRLFLQVHPLICLKGNMEKR